MPLENLFQRPKPVIGVIHVGALPGTPENRLSVAEIVAAARREARVYRDGGADGIIVENMHDVPYLRGAAGPEITAAMAVVGQAVKAESALPVGVQILAGANAEALAVAHAAGLDFIRAEGFVFAHVADEGIIEACAGPLLRYRRQIGAQAVKIWTDVKKKHAAHALTGDVSLGATAEAVEFMGGDAVIVTGGVTGQAPNVADVREAKTHCRLPVLLGSGISADNLADFFAEADGFIIGTYFKRDGHWRNEVEAARVEKLVRRAAELHNHAEARTK
jgi:membrane complex biogenesis BtpA family protein